MAGHVVAFVGSRRLTMSAMTRSFLLARGFLGIGVGPVRGDFITSPDPARFANVTAFFRACSLVRISGRSLRPGKSSQ